MYFMYFIYITYICTYQQGKNLRKICSFTLHLEQFLPPPKVNSFPTK